MVDPTKDKNINYLKYPIYLGGNRGRGQLYPDGSKSNNNIFNSSVSGQITEIKESKKFTSIIIKTSNGEEITESIAEKIEAAKNLAEANQACTEKFAEKPGVQGVNFKKNSVLGG